MFVNMFKIQKLLQTNILPALFVAVMLAVVVCSLRPVVVHADDFSDSKSKVQCSAQTINKTANCEVVQDCKDGLDPKNCGITRYVQLFINILSAMVGVTVVAVLVFSGIQYSASGGDANAVAAARKRILNALLAIVVFAFTYGFLQWIVPGGLF